METKELYSLLMHQKYYDGKSLKYRNIPGTYISPFEYGKLLDYFDEKSKDNKDVIPLSLLSFNKYNLRISMCLELQDIVSDYIDMVLQDNNENKSFLYFRNLPAITKSRIYSEVEGSLNIESVPTTRKLLDELLYKGKTPSSNNEQIIVNMSKAIEFVNSCPTFDENNLFKLYSILSNNCLDDYHKLSPNELYRYDEVEVDNYLGCPHDKIKECMDSLFKFVNDNLSDRKISFFLPHIAHYYIVYIHPYFDFNGRTARMVSYWISLLLNNKVLPLTISDAISNNKNEYYQALRETRNAHNDVTYFLLFILKESINYFLVYKNIEHLEKSLLDKDIVLTELDKNYLKNILIKENGSFTYEDFLKWSKSEMSKQGALKILNKFCNYQIIKSCINSSNKKLFSINDDMILYRTKIK